MCLFSFVVCSFLFLFWFFHAVVIICCCCCHVFLLLSSIFFLHQVYIYMQNTDGFHNIAFDYILFAFCSFNSTSSTSFSFLFIYIYVHTYRYTFFFIFNPLFFSTITKKQNNCLVFVCSRCYFLFEAF